MQNAEITDLTVLLEAPSFKLLSKSSKKEKSSFCI